MQATHAASGGGVNGAQRVLVVAIVVLGVLAAPALALAHALGNFTINTSAGIVLRVDEIVLDFAVDMAEIPTLHEKGRLDPDGDGSRSTQELVAYRTAACEGLRKGLRLRIDGTVAPLTVRSSELSLP